jgi:hypothetical protein
MRVCFSRLALGSWLLSVLLAALACASARPNALEYTGDEAVAAIIYSQVLADIRGAEPGAAVLDTHTSFSGSDEAQWYSKVDSSCINPLRFLALKACNDTPRIIPPAIRDSLGPHLTFPTDEQRDTLAAVTSDKSLRFTRSFPGAGAVLRVSTIAFTPDRRTATVYVSQTRLTGRSSGELYLFLERDGIWRPYVRLNLWESLS